MAEGPPGGGGRADWERPRRASLGSVGMRCDAGKVWGVPTEGWGGGGGRQAGASQRETKRWVLLGCSVGAAGSCSGSCSGSWSGSCAAAAVVEAAAVEAAAAAL